MIMRWLPVGAEVESEAGAEEEEEDEEEDVSEVEGASELVLVSRAATLMGMSRLV
jgi:hypothetical protein